MVGIAWELEDPIVEDVKITQGEQGFWTVSVTLREQHPRSLEGKVIRAKLIDQGRFFGKEIASRIWAVESSRHGFEVSKTAFTFDTGSTEYPEHTKVELEFFEK